MEVVDLESLLVGEGVAAPPDEIRATLARATDEGLNPIEALVDTGVIVEDVMAEVLARACGSIVVDLDSELDAAGADLLPRRLASDHLLIPVAPPTGGRVRIAFANPLDAMVRGLVEETVGMRVQVLVGTVGGIRRAIDRAYASRTTRVIGADGTREGREIQPEITRRMLAPSGDTSPLVRMEAQATMEQRHEALLLALVELGVLTRADYHAALKRLLSGRRDER
ncbi:MAG: hypothetical protein AB7S26_16045 [Sandaracinaceae bacterium]